MLQVPVAQLKAAAVESGNANLGLQRGRRELVPAVSDRLVAGSPVGTGDRQSQQQLQAVVWHQSQRPAV